VSLGDDRYNSFSNVKIIDCDWNDVRFVNCKMVDATFTKVQLKNVRFYNVDFQRLKVVGLDLENVVWDTLSIEQCYISRESFSSPISPCASITLPLPSTSVLSRTNAAPLWARCLSDMERDPVALDGSSLDSTVQLTTAKAKVLTDLPRTILEKIVSHLYHRKTAYIYDRPPNLLIGDVMTTQTTYLQANGSSHTTYVAYSSSRTVGGLMKRPEKHAQLGLCTALLYTNRTLFEIAVERVYDRTFSFPQSVKSCLAFLHDHRMEIYRVAKLLLWYASISENRISATSLADWRRLFNVQVNEREDLKEVRLVIRKGFWEVAPWKDGVGAVFGKWIWPSRSSAEGDGSDKKANFLQHVAGLSGVKFVLGHQRDDTASNAVENQAFRSVLTKRILQEMSARPKLAKGRYGSCNENRLECCCYYQPQLER